MKIAKRVVAKEYATKEFEKIDAEQLRHDLLDRRKHLFALRSQAVTEKLEDPSQLRKTRKEIARIYRVMRERELGIITLIEDSGEALIDEAGENDVAEEAGK